MGIFDIAVQDMKGGGFTVEECEAAHTIHILRGKIKDKMRQQGTDFEKVKGITIIVAGQQFKEDNQADCLKTLEEVGLDEDNNNVFTVVQVQGGRK